MILLILSLFVVFQFQGCTKEVIVTEIDTVYVEVDPDLEPEPDNSHQITVRNRARAEIQFTFEGIGYWRIENYDYRTVVDSIETGEYIYKVERMGNFGWELIKRECIYIDSDKTCEVFSHYVEWQ